jgi:polyvinyl alcohol dehydrogenase (cytochrome)
VTTTLLPVGASSSWTTYQNGDERLGAAAPQPALTPIRMAWTAPLDGAAVYGQPLMADGRILVATEADDVYALDPHNGSEVWSVHIGTPLRDVVAAAGCGNVQPLGVTSTPVVDPATGILYVVGEVSTDGRAPIHHDMTAIDIRSGKVVSTSDADPPLAAGEDPVHLLQRAALALGNGRVYVGYGGQYGDCGTYHGWLVAMPEVSTHGSPAVTKSAFNVTPSGTGGAIWQGGAAPSIGSDGSLFASTGNPNSDAPAPWAESVVKLAPALGPSPEASFRDRGASGDLDLSAGDPVLLPGGDLFTAGKAHVGYLLRQSDLGRIATIPGVCGSDPDGGMAFDSNLNRLYVPCRDGGLQEIDLARNSTGWRSGQVNSTPILVNGDLWALSYRAGRLEELDPATGHVWLDVAVGRSVPNFASPAAADGLLLVPTNSGIVAFSGPGGPPPS